MESQGRRPIGPATIALASSGFILGLALALVLLRHGPEEPQEGPEEVADPEIPALPFGSGEPLEIPEALARDPDMANAGEALRAGRLKEAIERFDGLCRRHPDLPEPLLGLGEALEALGEKDRAERAFLSASELAPLDPRPFYRLGRIADARRQTQVALARYREALKADPTFAPAVHYLAYRLRDSGAYEEAVKLLTGALARDPEDLSLRLNLAHTYLRQGDARKAAGEFRRAIARSPEIAEAHCFLGRALEILGSEREAEEALRKSLACDPGLPMAWYALAQLHRREGKGEDSARELKEFERARSLQERIKGLKDHLGKHPRDVRSMVELGSVLLERGKPQEALESLRRALELDRTNPGALEVLPRAEAEVAKKRSRRGRS